MTTRGLIGIILVALLLGGCGWQGDWDDSQVPGSWTSPASGATLVFREDGTFIATDYPVSSSKRVSFEGTWSADDFGFVYIDVQGEQLWKRRTASGEPALELIWDVEAGIAAETYVKDA